MSSPRCFVVNANDNVATLLDDAAQGSAELLGSVSASGLQLVEPILLGHKVALQDIQSGQPILKFGEVIGAAKMDIPRGSWVHLHNLSSRFDERSGTLDVKTGAVTDTTYE
jgi:altronate dehydratase